MVLMSRWHPGEYRPARMQRRQERVVGMKNSKSKEARNLAARADALKLLKSPRIFNKFLEVMEKVGLVGEWRNALVLLIVVVSRLLPRPISAFVKGRSASGKNWLVRCVLLLMPRGRVRELTSMSDRAFNYSKDRFRHRVAFLQERNQTTGTIDPMRILLSEGRIIRNVTEWVDGKRVTRQYVARGPVAAISTTSKSNIEIDDQTRHVSILVDESPEQTRRIVRAYANQGEALSEDEQKAWEMVHRLIEERADLEIVFPAWFDAVADSVFVGDVSVRRYYPAFVEACRTVCLIRSFQRDRQPAEGSNVELEFTDFAIAAIIFDRVFVETLRQQEGSALEVRQVVKDISDSNRGASVQAEDMARVLGISLDRAYKRLREGVKAGVIRQVNAPEKDNRKLYLPAPRLRFIPDPGELFPELDGVEDEVRFVHPITGNSVTYSGRAKTKQNGKKKSA
jgi:DNA primase